MPSPSQQVDIGLIIARVRDALIQNPLPRPGQLDVGTLTIHDGLHIEGSDIQMSPAAVARLKTILGI